MTILTLIKNKKIKNIDKKNLVYIVKCLNFNRNDFLMCLYLIYPIRPCSKPIYTYIYCYSLVIVIIIYL